LGVIVTGIDKNSVLNSEYVDKDEYRRIAGGALKPGYEDIDDGSGDARLTDWRPGDGGMISPRPEIIPAGRHLVRFAGLSPKKDTQKVRPAPQYFGSGAASGAWWIEWSAYKSIERYADRIGESVAYAMRQVCAVPPGWSDMSYLVQGTTRSPLFAYAGHGKPVKAEKGVIDPLARGKPRIEQLYIPGLSDPDLNKKAIIVHSHAAIDPTMSHKGARGKAEFEAARRKRLEQFSKSKRR
jgi:hypothetical protein